LGPDSIRKNRGGVKVTRTEHEREIRGSVDRTQTKKRSLEKERRVHSKEGGLSDATPLWGRAGLGQKKT